MIKEFQGEYRWLSNFYPVTVELYGEYYPSVENAYQAAKSSDYNYREFCKLCTPGASKKQGRLQDIRPDWNAVRMDIMEALLRQKFNQEPFKQKLIDIGDQPIVEGNNWGDVFWGVSLKSGKGENNLGKLIMKIQSELCK
jgi:ribA/ribD-fused uncharacterized protein